MPIVEDIPRLLTHPREQYIRQNEARIADAIRANSSEPFVILHAQAVEMAQSLIDVHEAAAVRQLNCDAIRVAQMHQGYAAQATQLKLYHLSQIATHIF